MKRDKKSALSLLLAILTVAGMLPTLFIGVGAAAPADGRVFTESEELYLGKVYKETPLTFAATVYAPATSSRPGIILGNYQKNTACLSFEIGADGKPRLYIISEDGATAQEYSFNYDVRSAAGSEKWVHVVIVVDKTELRCYIDGTLAEATTLTVTYDINTVTATNALMLGRDPRTDYVFEGKIRDVAVYSKPLSPLEVKSVFENGVDTTNAALLGYYDMKSPTAGSKVVKDLSGNGYDFSALWYEREEKKTDYAYSLAVIGDTQKLVHYDANNDTSYTAYIYDWLVKNKESKKIQAVLGVGDITDKNTDPEWVLIKEQLKKLDNANMLYSLIVGNHDKVAKLDEYFAGESYYNTRVSGYYKNTSLGNYYINFNVGETKYMIMCLQYGAGDEILAWAGKIISENPDRRVIITTHAYMYRDGTTLDVNDVYPPNTTGVNDGVKNNGDQMWDKLASRYENIVMVLSGHDPCADVVMRQDKGIHGNTVSQFLVDFQTMDKTYGYETGMVAMLYFSEDGREVSVEFISAYKTLEAQKEDPNAGDVLYKASNQFDFTAIERGAAVVESTETVVTSDGKSALRVHYSDGTFEDILLPTAEAPSGEGGSEMEPSDEEGKPPVGAEDDLNWENGSGGSTSTVVLSVVAAVSVALNLFLAAAYVISRRKEGLANEGEKG